jgi:hypothetical protein
MQGVPLILAMFFLLVGTASSARAGDYQLLDKKRYERALAEDFYDWERIQEIWRTAEDYAALQREFDKCRKPYEPWLASYLEHERDALEALKSHPERAAIERCHDMQLAYEHWKGNVYTRLKNKFKGTDVCSSTFAERAKKVRGKVCNANPGSPRFRSLDCITFPDWRTDAEKAEERARDAHFVSLEGDEVPRWRKERREECREERAREAAEASAGSPL